jgi:hypothetical protein
MEGFNRMESEFVPSHALVSSARFLSKRLFVEGAQGILTVRRPQCVTNAAGRWSSLMIGELPFLSCCTYLVFQRSVPKQEFGNEFRNEFSTSFTKTTNNSLTTQLQVVVLMLHSTS